MNEIETIDGRISAQQAHYRKDAVAVNLEKFDSEPVRRCFHTQTNVGNKRKLKVNELVFEYLNIA